MNEQKSGSNGGAGDEKPEQGHRSMDQMGTHGGPGHGGGGDGGSGYGGSSETSGQPGSPSGTPKEGEGAAEQALSRVKNLARGLMEKAADALETGVQSAEVKLGELAKDAAKLQERFAKQRASKPAPAKPAPKARAKAAGRAKVARKAARKAAPKGARKAAKAPAKKGARRAAAKATRRPAKGGRGKSGGGKSGGAKRAGKARRSRR
jgi:hypothetical protein